MGACPFHVHFRVHSVPGNAYLGSKKRQICIKYCKCNGEKPRKTGEKQARSSRIGCFLLFGGDKGTRTPDFCIANAALYQLSYIPKWVMLPDKSLTAFISYNNSRQKSIGNLAGAEVFFGRRPPSFAAARCLHPRRAHGLLLCPAFSGPAAHCCRVCRTERRMCGGLQKNGGAAARSPAGCRTAAARRAGPVRTP